MMRKYAALLAIVVSVTFAAARAAASPLSPAAGGVKSSSEPATPTKLVAATPAPAANSHPAGDHAFQVNDAKGLLLSCVAPQIDTDPDTDIFNSCALAPGRTLDDVMHTFIQAIHFVQNKQVKERAECEKSHEGESVLKPAQK